MTNQEIITNLNLAFNASPGTFDFIAGQYLAGEKRGALRSEIYEHVTRNKAPRNITHFAVADALKNSFIQPSLF